LDRKCCFLTFVQLRCHRAPMRRTL
jgi:hypothetical protein